MNYKHLAAALMMAAAMLAPLAATSAADSDYEGHVWTHNNTDTYLWVTAMGLTPGSAVHNVGAWCVAPGKFDQHGLHAQITQVRGEVAHGPCQAHPVILDTTLSFRLGQKTWVYTLNQKGKAYSFTGPERP